MALPTPAQQTAVVGLVASLRSLNAAATSYFAAFGVWPRLSQSAARILATPLDAVEMDQLLDIAVLEVVSGDG